MKTDTTSPSPSPLHPPASPSPSKKKETVYEVGDVFHHPLTDYFETAITRWKKGVKIVRENPPSSYLEEFHIFTGLWDLYGWGKWYRLLDADGSQFLDYYILSDKEVKET